MLATSWRRQCESDSRGAEAGPAESEGDNVLLHQQAGGDWACEAGGARADAASTCRGALPAPSSSRGSANGHPSPGGSANAD